MTYQNGLCYCEGPWHGRLEDRPASVIDRAHIPGGVGCLSARRPTRVPEWIARKNRGMLPAKELVG
jgi:hypothetical protein